MVKYGILDWGGCAMQFNLSACISDIQGIVSIYVLVLVAKFLKKKLL